MSLTDFPKIVGAFEKAVPYVKVRANRLSQSSVLTKIDTEARAGLFAVDVIGSAPVEMWELKQKGHSLPICRPNSRPFRRVPMTRRVFGRPSRSHLSYWHSTPN